jgi:hypothetical protein
MENGTVVRKFKLWFVWQDQQHQQWLQQMAAQGLHLRSTNTFCVHSFERGAPADMAYRWDVRYFQPDADYRQLLHDAGWQHVTSTVGWHCWRKPHQAGATAEIFTDRDDQAAKYQRVIQLLALVVSAEALAYWLVPAHVQHLEGVAWGMFCGTAAVATYTLTRLSKRMKEIRGV